MKKLLFILFAFNILFFSITSFATSTVNTNKLTQTFVSETQGLRPQVVQAALTAYNNALKHGIKDNKQLITIIDYSLPSSEKRLWVLDLQHQKVLFHTWVSHGKNSGVNMASHFSNDPQSLESSIGLYLTKGTYDGRDGYSLALKGLDKGFNDNAERRHIIMHGADYVSQDILNANGRIGRSWGCPAMSEQMAPQIISTIKDGTLVLAYYPDKDWLEHSVYLA
jgi:hypothetical protein